MNTLRQVVVSAAAHVVRRKRIAVTVAVAALLLVPLVLTGDVDLFALNALGLGIAALVVRRVARRFARRP